MLSPNLFKIVLTETFEQNSLQSAIGNDESVGGWHLLGRFRLFMAPNAHNLRILRVLGRVSGGSLGGTN